MKNKNGWNYRFIRGLDKTGDYYFNVHEVYYIEDKPTSWSKDPMYAQGETPIELMEDLLMMTKGFHLPILEVMSNADGKEELVEVSVNRVTGKDK